MANSNKEQSTTKPLEQNPPNESLPLQSTIACPRKSHIIMGVTSLIAITAIVTALYNTQHNSKLQNQLLNEQKELSIKLQQLNQQQNQIQSQIDKKTDTMQQTQSDLHHKIDGLNKQLQTAVSQRLYQNQDWLLLKARYYLELAQINAHWSDNYNATVELLQQSDKLLAQLNAPQIFTIRQAIAKEISQLKSTPTLDIAGLLSQLDAAQISVSNLTIQSTIAENNESTADASETPKNANPSAWRARLQDSVNLLEKLVVIRRNDEEVKPLMSPLFESILRESIRLNLQEAQWAILNNNPTVYQLALKQAIMNLKRTFDEESPNAAVLLKHLSALQQIKLVQEKPVIGQALPLLNQMIDSKELLSAPAHNSRDGDN